MLEIRTTQYEMNTLMESSGNICYPIIGLDLWEHAFFYKYTYEKASFIDDIWNLIDWKLNYVISIKLHLMKGFWH